MTTQTSTALTSLLVDQLDWHWRHQLRPRLDGLADDEYFWAPVPECWTIHPGGSIDFTYPQPDPPPFTTIAWRLAHVIVGVLAVRTHSHFDGPSADYQSWPYAEDAKTALRQLDEAYAGWISGLQTVTEDDLYRPCGPAEGPYATEPFCVLILHINREMIHHGAEIACIRDLDLHTTNTEES